MKKLAFLLSSLFCLFFIVGSAEASSGFSHVISLEPGWNLVSTPRLLSSHEFSASSTSANYDIYVMNPSSASKWSTMGEMNQTEFEPLFGYFINNKVGTTTTLTFNYREDTAPNERFFLRSLQAGWNAIGVANPSYALKQKDSDGVDTDNVKSIINSIGSVAQSVFDLTANQSPKSTTKISNSWSNYAYNDSNAINDFRETKAYVAYLTSNGVYTGTQNNDTIILNSNYPSPTTTTPATLVKDSDYIDQNIAPQPNFKIASFNFDRGDSYRIINKIVIEIIPENGSNISSTTLSNIRLDCSGTSESYFVNGVVDNIRCEPYHAVEIYADISPLATGTAAIKVTASVSNLQNQEEINEDINSSGQRFTITSGTLKLSGWSQVPTVVVASSTVVTQSIKVEASNDSFTLNDLIIGVSDDAARYSLRSSSTISIMDGVSEIQTKLITGTSTTFSNLNINIPKNGYKNLSIVYNIKNPSDWSGLTGAFFETGIRDYTAIDHNGLNITQKYSLYPWEMYLNDLRSSLFSIRKSAPTITSNPLTSSSLVNGLNTLASFNINANPNGDISWKKITFGVNSGTTTVSSYKLYNSDDSEIAGSFSSPSQGVISFMANSEQQVLASTTNNYYLRAEVTNATSSNVNVYLCDNNYCGVGGRSSYNQSYYKNVNGLNASGALFIWSDLSEHSHSEASLDWYGDSVSNVAGWYLTKAAIGALTTTRNDGYTNNKTIIQGASNVSLGKFSIKATDDDIRITSVSLSPNASTTPASTISDIKLFIDSVQVGSTRDFDIYGATFSNLNIQVPKDVTKNLEIVGSFDASAVGGFETLMALSAQDSSGTSVISGNTASTTNFAIVELGTLNAELGNNTPAAGMLVSKNVEQEVAQFKFTAINDDASLTELNIINTAIGTTSISSSSAGVASADPRIATIKLYDGATLIDSFAPVNGAGKFTITNNAVNVLANQNKILTIKVVLNNISNDAEATNKDIHLGITTLKFTSSNGYETTQDVTILANNFRIRKTVPTVALNALPSQVVVAGDQVVSKFTVTADSNGDIELNKVVLGINNSASTTITALTVGSTLKVNGSYKIVTSVVYTDNKLTIQLATNEVISAGTSKTFEVLVNLATPGQGEYVATRLIGDTEYANDGSGNFVWSDGASIAEPTYSNGFTVNGLPTDNQILSNN